ncbi:hypothetical protein E2562_038902 [Oryza meyeriana var. granulata]|uniref:Uncharacterized protein n=1 Tax=Oryza meyeriana var. granulata TaxID=110450 RepID=A0A6G1CC10_9ORYZ|nr:hypothetical protein E2562_038902 [Oryza meyeriana var. granulata]
MDNEWIFNDGLPPPLDSDDEEEEEKDSSHKSDDEVDNGVRDDTGGGGHNGRRGVAHRGKVAGAAVCLWEASHHRKATTKVV